MADFDDTNRGALFLNDKKEEGSKHPDYTGTLNVEGKEYRLAGWKRQSKNGKTFLSVSISEPREGQGNGEPRKSPAKASNDGW